MLAALMAECADVCCFCVGTRPADAQNLVPKGSRTHVAFDGSLSATTINIPLSNSGGVLRTQTLPFSGTWDIANVMTNAVGTTTFSGTNSYTQSAAGILAIDIAAVNQPQHGPQHLADSYARR